MLEIYSVLSKKAKLTHYQLYLLKVFMGHNI